MTRMIRTTDRALPCPFAAPMSAFRHAGVFASAASATGPVKVRTKGLAGSSAARSNGRGGGGTTSAIRPQSSSRAPIWKSAPMGPAISSATNCLSVLPLTRRMTSPTKCPWFSAW